jgi:hypothetical protein
VGGMLVDDILLLVVRLRIQSLRHVRTAHCRPHTQKNESPNKLFFRGFVSGETTVQNVA